MAVLAGIAVAALGGCSANDSLGTFIVDPGRYTLYHCKDLEARLTVLVAREQKLSGLMDKANESSTGVLIGNLSYRADYENALGEETVLRRTAAEKNCDLPPPAATASTMAPPPGSAAPPVAPALPVATTPPATTPTSYQSDQTIR